MPSELGLHWILTHVPPYLVQQSSCYPCIFALPMLNGLGHIVLFASRDMECSVAACVLLYLLFEMMAFGTQVTIRWHEADLRVRASLTLPAAKDKNAMSSMLDVVWDSLEITQVPSCLCPSSGRYILPCTGSSFE